MRTNFLIYYRYTDDTLINITYTHICRYTCFVFFSFQAHLHLSGAAGLVEILRQPITFDAATTVS